MDLQCQVNLLLLNENDFSAPNRVVISDRRFLQLRDIIGLEKGKSFRAGLRDGLSGNAVLVEYSDKEAILETDLTTPPPPEAPVTLVCALPRPQTFGKVLHGAITMGVKNFYFIHSRKVEKSYWNSSALRPEAIEHEITLALEQCGDTISPKMEFRQRFKPFVEDELPELVKQHDAAIFGHPRATLPVPTLSGKKTILVIGPEGGFNEFENQTLEKAGVMPVSLGARVLRTEFAVTALLAKVI